MVGWKYLQRHLNVEIIFIFSSEWFITLCYVQFVYIWVDCVNVFMYFLFCSRCFFTPTSRVYACLSSPLPCCVLCSSVPRCSSWHPWRSLRLALYTRLLMLGRYKKRWGRKGAAGECGGTQSALWIWEKSKRRRRKKSQGTIIGESNEMYQWLNYSPSRTPWQLNWAFLPPLIVHGAVSGTLQRPFNFGRPGEPVEQPAGGAVHPLLGGQGRGVPQVVRRADPARDPLAASAEGGSGQPEASWARSVTEGMEPGVLWPETGPNRVNERTGLLVGRRKDWQHPWGSNSDDVQRRMCYMREHYM